MMFTQILRPKQIRQKNPRNVGFFSSIPSLAVLRALFYSYALNMDVFSPFNEGLF